MNNRFYMVVGSALLVTLAQQAAGGTIERLSPQLRKDVECMRGVLLKEAPGVDEINVEMGTPYGSALPIISYRAAKPDWRGVRITVHFQAEEFCSPTKDINCCPVKYKHACFVSVFFSGRFGPEGQPPGDGGASSISAKWRDECGVEASILFA